MLNCCHARFSDVTDTIGHTIGNNVYFLLLITFKVVVKLRIWLRMLWPRAYVLK